MKKTRTSNLFFGGDTYMRKNIQENNITKFNKNGDNEELKCDVCGMSYSEFLKTGIFGCQNCYRVFKTRTVEIIKNNINNAE